MENASKMELKIENDSHFQQKTKKSKRKMGKGNANMRVINANKKRSRKQNNNSKRMGIPEHELKMLIHVYTVLYVKKSENELKRRK